MSKIKYILIAILILMMKSCSSKEHSISVLQFNIWQEGTMVEDGFNMIVDNIIQAYPDMVTFSEVRNYDDIDFISSLTKALSEKGHNYYGNPSNSTGIISKYPIIKQSVVYPLNNDAGSITKALIDVKGKTVALYSAHLDYRHYSCYLPRGYDGSTWQKIDESIIDADSILSQSRKSKRLEAINVFIEDSRQEILQGNIVIMGGDLNEPSHLDWTTETKDLWDHNGAIVEWEVSKKLSDNGFIDTYRYFNSDVVNYPGFTYPSGNDAVEVSKLTWAPEADERERIDFIYFHADNDILLYKSTLFGPPSYIVNGKEHSEVEDKEHQLHSTSTWPSDHKGVISSFRISKHTK